MAVRSNIPSFRFMSIFEPPAKFTTDNCVVNVVHFGDQLYALTESTTMRRVDPHTLDCVGGMASTSVMVILHVRLDLVSLLVTPALI